MAIENKSFILPDSLKDLNLSDPAILQYYENLSNRMLWLDSQVDGYWLEFEKRIIQWNLEDKDIPIEERKPIKLFFYSYGGDLEINHSFIDVIETSQTPVWGINMGQACSAACFIFMACAKRFTMPRASFLLHQGGVDGGFSGTYEQVVAAIVEYQRQIEELGKYVLEHTKITQEELDEKFTSEWYMTSEEAVERGVADKIIKNIDEVF